MTQVKNIIWTSGEGRRIKNLISKKGSPKTHINKVFPALTFSFGCSPHKYTCGTLTEDLLIIYNSTMFFKKMWHSIGVYK